MGLSNEFDGGFDAEKFLSNYALPTVGLASDIASGISRAGDSEASYEGGIYTPAYNPTFVDPNNDYGKKYAQKTRADLARAQWADHKARYKPIEDMLINNVTGGERLNTALSKGGAALEQQYGIADDTFQRNNSRYGIGLTPQQETQHQARLGLSKAAAEANLRNTTRRSVADSNMTLISGLGGTKEEMA